MGNSEIPYVVAGELLGKSPCLYYNIPSQQGKFLENIKNWNGKLSHHHENGNITDRTSMNINLSNTNLLDEI